MITQKRVQEVFDYTKGCLYWKINLGSRAKAGSRAGNKNKGGYLCAQVDGTQYYIHRLIWLYHYGYLPEFIDHKYGKEVGDYLWNLRACTRSQNMANTKINTRNKSGYKNVFWQANISKWCAVFRRKGEWYYCGYFKEKEDAHNAVKSKIKEIGCKFSNKRI